jgi:uncharacterized membrane protein
MNNENENKLIATDKSIIIYDGPLPPAEEYGRYEQAYHGTAERMLKMAEIEVEHRHNKENREIDIASRGQIFAFIIGIVSLCAAVLCAFLNQAVVAVVPAILGCVSLAAVFLRKKR